jgi:hypothetical protein
MRPAKLAWTTTYRKAHKKDQVAEAARKKRRGNGKAAVRSIAGVSMEVINKKRTEKPEVGRVLGLEQLAVICGDACTKAKQPGAVCSQAAVWGECGAVLGSAAAAAWKWQTPPNSGHGADAMS